MPNFTRKDHHFSPGQSFQKQVVLINDAREPRAFTARWSVAIGGKQILTGEKSGRLAVGEKLFLPVDVHLPEAGLTDGAQGVISLDAEIGDVAHRDQFAFSVFTLPAPAKETLSVFDPVGETSKLLGGLGYQLRPWTSGPADGDVVVIGAKALSDRHVLPGEIDAYLKTGGRVIVFGQDNDWTRLSLQLRTAPHVSRRVFGVGAAHPVTAGMTDDNLRDWNGSGSLVAAYPYRPGLEWLNTYGWHWGNRGSVSSCSIEKPHRSSLRPVLEDEFDLAYSPLMEMEYGHGRLTLCTLDFENRGDNDPAATKLLAQLMHYVRTAPIRAKAADVAYTGDDAGAALLDDLGVAYRRLDTATGANAAGADLLIVGKGVDLAVARASAAKGSNVLVMARDVGVYGNVRVETKNDFQGSITVPDWPACAGLSPSDLHWKTVYTGRVLTATDAGIEVAADGLLAREKVGDGEVLFTQIDPTYLPADEKHYFRFTRWRQTRALSQLLSNLGATFRQDAALVSLIQKPEQGYMLAGQWEVALTTPLKESPDRVWNGFRPISDVAAALVKAGPGEGEGWQTCAVPALLESYRPASKWRWADGECVFRKVVDVPAYLAGREFFVSVGRVDESEETFVNGTSVGKSRNWLHPRGHVIPAGLMKAGRNVIALRTWDEGISGGLCGPSEQYFLKVNSPDVGFYHADYVTDQVTETDDADPKLSEQQKRWNVADNPYRYTRW